MRVTFLGTGSAMPTGKRVQSGILLEDDENTLLVDCGSGVLHRLAATPAGYEGVDTVLLTHHHTDHVSDLLPLLKARWLAGEESLTVAGPPGTTDLVAGLLDVHDYLRDRVDLTLRDIEGEFSVAGFDVASMETRHSMQCFAYRIDDFAYSGDSEAFDGLAAFADGAEAFVHDCSFPDEVDVSNHPTPSALGRALAGNDYGTVYLTHRYPHTDGKEEELLDSIRERYGGDVELAREGDTIEV
ncbi:MBL fold metallo-hydrolase [Salarchaeum sp. JOR-1]|uniref:MBL fold metallo-hydrolase n=1 Tax=Salarchaeum sp. JOR-1 TaxID=2599399 RepID=UPI001198BCFD|nr:MBL fold metallo-hydrolase [Salarchaeum sp. JOR-1]QDX41656.1 MBL fold metallo-hydrolase [Salarchaeum sp. JOR-1]